MDEFETYFDFFDSQINKGHIENGRITKTLMHLYLVKAVVCKIYCQRIRYSSGKYRVIFLVKFSIDKETWVYSWNNRLIRLFKVSELNIGGSKKPQRRTVRSKINKWLLLGLKTYVFLFSYDNMTIMWFSNPLQICPLINVCLNITKIEKVAEIIPFYDDNFYPKLLKHVVGVIKINF